MEGLYVASMVPFDEDGKINDAVAREMIETNLAEGAAGFFGLFGGFCGRDSGIGPAQRAKTTIWN